MADHTVVQTAHLNNRGL